MNGGVGSSRSGPVNMAYPASSYPRQPFPSTASTSSNGQHKPYHTNAPPPSTSTPSGSSFAFARPMQSPSPNRMTSTRSMPNGSSSSSPSSSSAPPLRPPQGGRQQDDEVAEDDDDDDEEEESRSLSASHSPQAPAAKKVRRTHARRSCLACRKRKARCELPDITVPSSMDPLADALKCHRCKTLDTDCVVWDGDRKMKGNRPARYGPPQDKIIAAAASVTSSRTGTGRGRKSASLPRPHSKASESEKTEDAQGEGDGGGEVKSKKRKATVLPPTKGSRRIVPSYLPPRKIIPFDPPAQDEWPQGVPNLRIIPTLPKTVEQCRAHNLAISTEEVVDNFSAWDKMVELIDGPENSSANQPTSQTSSGIDGGPSTSGLANPGDASGLGAGHAGTASHAVPTGPAVSSVSTGQPLTSASPSSLLAANDSSNYKSKLTSATGRNAALMSEVIYASPEYRLRSRNSERIAYAYRGVPVVDDGSVPRDKVEALILAQPFLSPELVEPVSEGADPASGRVFLSNVVNYLCLKPDPPPDLTSFVIRHSSIHVIMQTRNREICAAMLLLVFYEATDMLLGKPAHDPDFQLDHVPGHHFYQTAMNCALSLGLDKVIGNMNAGPTALTTTSSMEERMARMRDAALWLTISNMGIYHAFATERPQLPNLFPSDSEIDAFEANIRPLLSASTQDNEVLGNGAGGGRTRQKSVSSSASAINPPPLTYQALAVSLSLLAQKARIASRIRAFWNRASVIDFCEARNLPTLSGLVLSMTSDITDCRRSHLAELEQLQEKVAAATPASEGICAGGPNDPIVALLTKWSEIEALEVLTGLVTRIMFYCVATMASREGSFSKASAFQGLDKLSPDEADAMAKLSHWGEWCNERLLLLASSLATPPSSSATLIHQEDRQSRGPSRPMTAERGSNYDFTEQARILHIIPHFQLCTAVFIAAKLLVERKLFTSFGMGALSPGCRVTLDMLGRGIKVLVTFAQGDRLSLPGIVANVLREFTKRFATLVKRSEEITQKNKTSSGSKSGGGKKSGGGGGSAVGKTLTEGGAEGDEGKAKARPRASRFAQQHFTSDDKQRLDHELHRTFLPGLNTPQAGHRNNVAEKNGEGEGNNAKTGDTASEPSMRPNGEIPEDHEMNIAEAAPTRLTHLPERSLLDLNDQGGHLKQTLADHPDEAFALRNTALSAAQGSNLQPMVDLDIGSDLDVLNIDGIFSALGSHWPSELGTDNTPGGTLTASLGDYSHATLDHILGTLDTEFMGFPLEPLIGSATVRSSTKSLDGSLSEAMPPNWNALSNGGGSGGNFEADRREGKFATSSEQFPKRVRDSSDGNLPPTGYPAPYSHGSNTTTGYSPSVTLDTTPGSSSYEGPTGSGASISSRLQAGGNSRGAPFFDPAYPQGHPQHHVSGPNQGGSFGPGPAYSSIGTPSATNGETGPTLGAYGYSPDGRKGHATATTTSQLRGGSGDGGGTVQHPSGSFVAAAAGPGPGPGAAGTIASYPPYGPSDSAQGNPHYHHHPSSYSPSLSSHQFHPQSQPQPHQYSLQQPPFHHQQHHQQHQQSLPSAAAYHPHPHRQPTQQYQPSELPSGFVTGHHPTHQHQQHQQQQQNQQQNHHMYQQQRQR